jgi:Endoplasmic Reticulum Oxidoreductin 1 (ERO1)
MCSVSSGAFGHASIPSLCLLVFLIPLNSALVSVKPYLGLQSPRTQCYINKKSIARRAVSVVSNNEELLPGIAAINQSNDDLHVRLSKLCDHPFFRLFSVDILASCEYMPQELFECYTETCEIYPEDENVVRRTFAGINLLNSVARILIFCILRRYQNQ